MRRLRLLIVCVGLVTAACGGSSGEESTDDPGAPTTTGAEQDRDEDTVDTGTTAPSTDPTQTTGGSGGETSEVGEAGSFTVNGTEFAVTFLNRCIPFNDSPGNLDLQALASEQGAKLNLYLEGPQGGTTDVSVDGNGIAEMFGSIAFGADSVVDASDVAGDRWTGSAIVADSLGSGDTVDITWDVMVPAEAQDCSL